VFVSTGLLIFLGAFVELLSSRGRLNGVSVYSIESFCDSQNELVLAEIVVLESDDEQEDVEESKEPEVDMCK
jgi:hypothetical protein